MAEETVVKEMLTQEMIQAGAEITRRLDEAHLEVRASLWWYILIPHDAITENMTIAGLASQCRVD